MVLVQKEDSTASLPLRRGRSSAADRTPSTPVGAAASASSPRSSSRKPRRASGLGAPSAPKCLLKNADDPTVQYHCYPSNPTGDFRPVSGRLSRPLDLTQLLSPTVEASLSALSSTPWCVEYRSRT